jgi:hypothetical protein
MRLIWVKWEDGTETRDDGIAIYHDRRFAMLRFPDGRLEKYPTAEVAKRALEEIERGN